jgi:hypothetical protein
MREAYQYLREVEGLKFHKMLGVGAGNGFSLKPDFQTYALLAVWEQAASFERFLEDNVFIREYHQRAIGHRHLLMEAYQSKGLWHANNPFKNQQGSEVGSHIAVLTRARIKASMAARFWWEVPKVSKRLYDHEACLFAKGVGEWPLIEQATFSIWNREKAMQAFAYRDKEHARVVKLTRELNWYSEELFARFQILASFGDGLADRFDQIEI